MFEKILYPTDFSDVSAKALDFIEQLREAGAQKVILLHVIDSRGVEAIVRYGYDDYAAIEAKLQAELEQDMENIANRLREIGFDVNVKIEQGVPFREILRVEKEEDVSVIVVGSHGVSNVEEMLLGSVSEKVVRKATKPVLVVKR
jgi:nucleotide-binding universal stress UspA family protein